VGGGVTGGEHTTLYIDRYYLAGKKSPNPLLINPPPLPLPVCIANTPVQDPIYVFPEMKLRGLVPNSYIHVSVCDLCIPTIRPPILLQQNRWTDRGNGEHRYMNVDIGNKKAANFHIWECIDRILFAVC
jgi:hypothetical protein